MNIVIMGATSHIAKGLIERFLLRGEDNLILLSRNSEKVRQFIISVGCEESNRYTIYNDYKDFLSFASDVIINCVGVETRNKHNCDFKRYFTVTEEFDNLAIDFLQKKNPEALYISFSSGAVYGCGFATPVDDKSINCIQVNHVAPEDYYGIVRINAEAKHRANYDLKIIDLRIFAYFSRYINLTDGYFITDVIEAILENKVLVTNSSNIFRDYLHPEDLFNMILVCIKSVRTNQAIDVNSISPVAKQEILDFYVEKYGLKYETRQNIDSISATGNKSNYYSTLAHASKLGFVPQFSSLETLELESKYILLHQNLK